MLSRNVPFFAVAAALFSSASLWLSAQAVAAAAAPPAPAAPNANQPARGAAPPASQPARAGARRGRGPAFSAVDPAQAGPDFLVQGEYVGEYSSAPKTRLGIQVIALGNAQFRAVMYEGGLPGLGAGYWDPTTTPPPAPKVEVTGQTPQGDKITAFASSDSKITLSIPAEGQTLKGKTEKGEFELKKIVRESPTLGAKPPQGAVVLFDGKNVDKWSKGNLEAATGLLAAQPGGGLTKDSYADIHLHLEFRYSFMPNSRGQDRANSGLYIQSRYEVQILDSFGLAGADNECGGIYQVSKPRVNMALPPLAWQTYDIDFTAAKYDAAGTKTSPAKITVVHNGVAIHENLTIPKATGSSLLQEGPNPAALNLQDHGNPVHFRNIWLVEKK